MIKITPNIFNEIDSGAQYYKAFYRGNLLPFYGITILLCKKLYYNSNDSVMAVN